MFSTIKTAAVGGLWKVGAIGLLVALVASSSYLGYQWHSAASARDTAIHERKKAEGDRDAAVLKVGELQAHIASQNASILNLATLTAQADERYAAALQALGPIKAGIRALADQIKAQPSTSCEQALAKQRQAVEGLRAVQP